MDERVLLVVLYPVRAAVIAAASPWIAYYHLTNGRDK